MGSTPDTSGAGSVSVALSPLVMALLAVLAVV